MAEDAPKRVSIRIKLTCGHWISARTHPWNDRSTYSCPMGLGCGYRLGWVRVEGSAGAGVAPSSNPLYPAG